MKRVWYFQIMNLHGIVALIAVIYLINGNTGLNIKKKLKKLGYELQDKQLDKLKGKSF